jgi:KUP system potassium uptake protein
MTTTAKTKEPDGPHHAAGKAALTLGAVGIVFGDIGTSPLYALQAVFNAPHHAVGPDRTNVYGVVSLVFWTITVLVSVKFVLLIMRADNQGEGGIVALIAKVQQATLGNGRRKYLLVLLGVFGAALFYGDGMITPAISVLSAVEGMELVSPSFKDWVVPITIAILTVLFAIQRFGTGVVGRLFGPIMVVWFAVIAVTGAVEIAREPEILKAIAPTYALDFLFGHFGTAFFALGSVVLTVTGGEALYADMGHFGRDAIRRAWYGLVFPALVLSYMGQGALVLRDPSTVENPFFLLMPDWARIPAVGLATVATVIASQAVISGAFSMTRQAMQLGFLPRVTVRQTSREAIGQIYVPAVNWFLYVAVVVLVVGFGSSQHLAAAYGIAVTGTMAIDTVLFFVVVYAVWHRSLRLALAGAAAFLTVDLTFLAAQVPKVEHGGWFALAVAAVIFTVLVTWQRGREMVTRTRTELEGPLRAFVDEVHAADPPAYRPPRTGVFLNAHPDTTPLALRANFEHNRVVHESVVIVSIIVERVPHVADARRASIDDLGYADDGIVHVTARYGFMDTIDVPRMLRRSAKRMEGQVDLDAISYFISRITIVPTRAPGMALWRKRLFIVLARNAANPVVYFGLPVDRTVVMGAQVDL